MTRPKKILNDPSRVVTESLDGLALASDGRLVRLEGRDAIVRSRIPDDKVALLIGGGSLGTRKTVFLRSQPNFACIHAGWFALDGLLTKIYDIA